MLINFVELLWWPFHGKAGPHLLEQIYVVCMNQLRQRVMDHSSVKGELRERV